MCRLLCTAIVALLAAAPAGAATLSATAQARGVEWTMLSFSGEYFCTSPQSCTPLSEETTTDGNSDAAPDFSPYVIDLDGRVQQHSVIEPKTIWAQGSHAASGSASIEQTPIPTFLTAYTEWTSRSYLSVDFEVDEAAPYTITGALSIAGGLSTGLVRVRLLDGQGAELFAEELSRDGSCLDPSCAGPSNAPLQGSGVLAPGTYTFEVELDGATSWLISISTLTAAAGSYEGSYDVTLALDPAPVPALRSPIALALLLLLSGLGLLSWRGARGRGGRVRRHPASP